MVGEKVTLKLLTSFAIDGRGGQMGSATGGRGGSIQNWSVFIQNRSARRYRLPVVSRLMTASGDPGYPWWATRSTASWHLAFALVLASLIISPRGTMALASG